MKSRFPLGWALGLGVFYALVTVFFIDGPEQADTRPLEPIAGLALLPD